MKMKSAEIWALVAEAEAERNKLAPPPEASLAGYLGSRYVRAAHRVRVLQACAEEAQELEIRWAVGLSPKP